MAYIHQTFLNVSQQCLNSKILCIWTFSQYSTIFCLFLLYCFPLFFTNSSLWWLALLVNSTWLRITWEDRLYQDFFLHLLGLWVCFLLSSWDRLGLLRMQQSPRYWDMKYIRMSWYGSKQASEHASINFYPLFFFLSSLDCWMWLWFFIYRFS